MPLLVLPEHRQTDVKFIVAQRRSKVGKKWNSVGSDQVLPDVPQGMTKATGFRVWCTCVPRVLTRNFQYCQQNPS